VISLLLARADAAAHLLPAAAVSAPSQRLYNVRAPPPTPHVAARPGGASVH